MRRKNWWRFLGVVVTVTLLFQTIFISVPAHAQFGGIGSGVTNGTVGATGQSSGTNSTATPAVSYTEDQVKTWLNFTAYPGGNDIQQDGWSYIVSDNNTATDPPSVTVTAAGMQAIGGQPIGDLVFKFTKYLGLGQNFVPNAEVLTFQAYLNGSPVTGLTLAASDKYDANIYWNTTEIDRLQTNGGFIDALFSYIDNVPWVTDHLAAPPNCLLGNSNLTVKITGPADATPKPDIQHTTDSPYNISGKRATDFNSNCANTGPNGWLSRWQVAIDQQVGGGDCAIDRIFGLGDIGTIFNQLTKCIFDKIFTPVVTWAADLVTKAAGISYLPRRELVAIQCKSLLSG